VRLACCSSQQRGRRGNHRAAARRAQCRRHGAQLHLRWRLVRRHDSRPINQIGRSGAVCSVIAPNGRLQRALATAADAAAAPQSSRLADGAPTRQQPSACCACWMSYPLGGGCPILPLLPPQVIIVATGARWRSRGSVAERIGAPRFGPRFGPLSNGGAL